MNAARAETALRDLEPASFPEQQIRPGHAHVFEQQLSMSVRRIVVPKNVEHANDGDARRIPWHQDHRLLLVAIGILSIRFSHHDQHLASRIADP